MAQQPAQVVLEPQAKASALPLLVPYSVIVQTADEPEAGTSGAVTLQMFGSAGKERAGHVAACMIHLGCTCMPVACIQPQGLLCC